MHLGKAEWRDVKQQRRGGWLLGWGGRNKTGSRDNVSDWVIAGSFSFRGGGGGCNNAKGGQQWEGKRGQRHIWMMVAKGRGVSAEKKEIIRDWLYPWLSTLAISQIELLAGYGRSGRRSEVLCTSSVGSRAASKAPNPPSWSSEVDNVHQECSGWLAPCPVRLNNIRDSSSLILPP